MHMNNIFCLLRPNLWFEYLKTTRSMIIYTDLMKGNQAT